MYINVGLQHVGRMSCRWRLQLMVGLDQVQFDLRARRNPIEEEDVFKSVSGPRRS